MNETRDLIIGIDLRNDSSQLCYYDRNADEPRSLPVKVGSSQYEVPTCLCRRVEQKDYCIGIEAEYFAREKGGFLIEDLCGIQLISKCVFGKGIKVGISLLIICIVQICLYRIF